MDEPLRLINMNVVKTDVAIERLNKGRETTIERPESK
jgi:hypothetical protein